MESTDFDQARSYLARARQALDTTHGSRPREAIALLRRVLWGVIKRDLLQWGLDARNVQQARQMVAAMVVYARREPVFRGHLQLLALLAVLEDRLVFQQGELAWQAWRRDALALVERLHGTLDAPAEHRAVPLSATA